MVRGSKSEAAKFEPRACHATSWPAPQTVQNSIVRTRNPIELDSNEPTVKQVITGAFIHAIRALISTMVDLHVTVYASDDPLVSTLSQRYASPRNAY